MSTPREGGCQCGAVRYRLVGDPVTTVACHCTECQRQSGSAFGMSLVVRREDFELLAGELRSFTRAADSGSTSEGFFCPGCGTRIYHQPAKLPTTVNVKPGTLDERSWLEPAAHVWVSSKQPWTPIPDGIPTFEKNPKGG